MRVIASIALAASVLGLAGCATQHEVKTESEVKPIYIKTEHEVKPIHITVDVNLKVDRQLDDFFNQLDMDSPLLQAPEEGGLETP